MTVITYTFNKAGAMSSTETENPAGHVGEHNAIQLNFKLNGEFCPAADYCRVHFEDFVSEELYPDENLTVSYIVPQALTCTECLTFQLAAYGAADGEIEVIAKTNIVSVRLQKSLSGTEQVCPEAVDQLETLMVATKKAAEDANTAAEAAADRVIAAATVSEEGELQLTYADGTTVNAGNVKGPKGDTGTYILPAASADNLGGIKVGEGLDVTADGTLSVEKKMLTVTYTVNTPAWENQPELIEGSADALSLWDEDFYFAHLTENAGEFNLMRFSGDTTSLVTDSSGTTLLFRFPSGTFVTTGSVQLAENDPVDVLSLDATPVLRYAGTSGIVYTSQAKNIFGRAPDRVEISVAANVFNGRANYCKITAANGDLRNLREVQFYPDGSQRATIIKNDNVSVATLIIYDLPYFTKKYVLVTFKAEVDFEGPAWHGQIRSSVCQSDTEDMEITAADSSADSFHSTINQMGYTVPLEGNINDSIRYIDYSSVSGQKHIRNGSRATIKEMIF